MTTVKVVAKSDYLERLARTRQPAAALAELIWNALDADAQGVSVYFDDSITTALERIRIEDAGTGMRRRDAIVAFGSLGGSWKRHATRTRTKDRLLHGRAGKGRFSAFALGNRVVWDTCYASGDSKLCYQVRGAIDRLGTFEVGEESPRPHGAIGTRVTIEEIPRDYPGLRGDQGVLKMTEEFAIYLRHYPDITITVDGKALDPSLIERDVTEVDLSPIVLADGTRVEATLVIIEWGIPANGDLFLCDADGVTLERVPGKVRAPNFDFTAYLQSDYLRSLDDKNLLLLSDMHEDLGEVIEQARRSLRDHFRGRAAERAGDLVSEWKEQEIYPYEGDPESPLEEAERQVFDVVALNVSSYLPDFAGTDVKTQRLSLRLIKQAIEESPSALQRILNDVLELPLERQEELAQLLERTTLSAIISASKRVANRLDFLRGLETMIFDDESKKALLERSQLHKILAPETWIFGEQFNMTVSDQSLDEVLSVHLAKLKRERDDETPVVRDDGRRAIVDLMLSRSIPQPRAEEHEHLIIELKRPSKRIDAEVLAQIKSYANAVARDERFRSTHTRWTFWAVSNKMNDDAREEANQRDRPRGLVHLSHDGQIQVWAREWGELINDCKARLRFFQQELEYKVSDESALSYLRAAHAEYLPDHLRQRP